MDLDFGVFGTIPPFTIDVFTDASRMVTVMVPQFEIGYATRPLPEGGQNVSTLVQLYSKTPTHDIWASADLLTCGRVNEYGNRSQTYDIFDIGLRGTGSTDYTTVNSSDFQFMTSLLRGVQIEMLKKNGSDYVCVNNEYVCGPFYKSLEHKQDHLTLIYYVRNTDTTAIRSRLKIMDCGRKRFTRRERFTDCGTR